MLLHPQTILVQPAILEQRDHQWAQRQLERFESVTLGSLLVNFQLAGFALT